MNNVFRALTTLFLGLSILGLLSACAAPPPVPEDNFYQLPAPSVTKQGVASISTLAVKRLSSDGLHSERAQLFSQADQPLQLRQYHYHHWIDAPPRLLQEHLISALRKAQIANTVINYDPGQPAVVTLSGKIRHFEQIERGKKNQVLVELELTLQDNQRNIILLNDYRVSQLAKSAKPHDLVSAYGEALNVVLNRFIQDWIKSNQAGPLR